MDSKAEQNGKIDNQEFVNRLKALEQRVTRLETDKKYYSSISAEGEITPEEHEIIVSNDAQLESSIGEYGLAWLGNIVLFFGITFFVQYLQVNEYKYLSPLFGYVSVGAILFLGYYLRQSNEYMSKIFNLNAYLLLFYVTLKLHFFNPNPVVASKMLGLVLLLTVVIVLIYLSIRKKSTIMAGFTLLLISATAILSDSSHILLSLLTIVSIVSTIFLYKFGWIRIFFLSVFITYFTYLIWMFGNPVMSHQILLINNHQSGFIYLFLIAAIFSLIALMPKKEELYSNESIIGAIIFSGIGFSFLMTLFIISFFKDNYVLLTGSIALYCIVYSIILKLKSNWQITSALYALFGFVTMSVSVYGLYDFPRAYFLLALQSLLVVSMAIWFRSKFIVIMNSGLFFILLTVYIASSDLGNGMNISFSVVALATARILNWKKDRLTIRTEFIRNFYLIVTFIMVLFTLYHLFPSQYISLSWTLAAVLYFVFSLLLRNVKYRYMALATMVAAALHLFIRDLVRIELVFRVIALLFLAIISIGLSFYYTKKQRKKME